MNFDRLLSPLGLCQRSTVEALNDRVAVLARDNELERRALEESRARLWTVGQEAERARGHIVELEREVLDRDIQVAELTGQLKAERATVASLREQLAIAETDLATVTRTADEAIRECTGLRAEVLRLADVERQLAELRSAAAPAEPEPAAPEAQLPLPGTEGTDDAQLERIRLKTEAERGLVLVNAWIRERDRHQWTVLIGGEKVKAKVTDRDFLERIGNNEIAFRHDTVLRVHLEMTSVRAEDGSQRTDYTISKVIDVVEPSIQLSLVNGGRA